MSDASTPLNDSHPTIQRCIAAYRRVRAELPKDPFHHVNLENQYKAYLAFCAELPLLIDPPSVLLYIACVGRGVGIGALDSSDAGRLGHLAQMAMSAWKLIHLTIPAAEQKQQEFQQKQEDAKLRRQQAANSAPSSGEQKAAPPLPKVTIPDDIAVEMALQKALDSLPRLDVQKQYFQLLRNHGHILPCDSELRDHPLAALHFCRMAQKILRDEAMAQCQPAPQPATEPAPATRHQPQQAA